MPSVAAQPHRFLAGFVNGTGEQISLGLRAHCDLDSLQFRTFEDLLRTLPADSSESLTLILAACKFIDLLLVLQTEEFQMHVTSY
jgi:hypothetical protein